MAKDNMTIRFTPDGFSFLVGRDAKGSRRTTETSLSDDTRLHSAVSSFLDEATLRSSASSLLDEVPFHEVAPGPDFNLRLQHEVLEALPECETPPDLTVQVVSDRVILLPPRVILLPPHITDLDTAALMYRSTLSEPAAPAHTGPLSESAVEEQLLLQPLTLPTGQRVVLCFGINRSLYLFLQRNFGDLTFEHHISTLLTKAAPASLPKPPMAAPSALFSAPSPVSLSQPSMAAQVTPQFLELVLFRQGKLALVNVYRTSHPDNRAYYVLNTWMREGLDQLHDRLLILGNGVPATQLHTALQPFIKHIN